MADRLLVFDIETVPDLAAARRLLSASPGIPDSEVRQIIGERYAKNGESPGEAFLKPNSSQSGLPCGIVRVPQQVTSGLANRETRCPPHPSGREAGGLSSALLKVWGIYQPHPRGLQLGRLRSARASLSGHGARHRSRSPARDEWEELLVSLRKGPCGPVRRPVKLCRIHETVPCRSGSPDRHLRKVRRYEWFSGRSLHQHRPSAGGSRFYDPTLSRHTFYIFDGNSQRVS